MSSRIFAIFIACYLVSCGQNSLEDYRERGEGMTRSLIKELEKIYTHEDLLEAKLELIRIYKEIAQVMVEARKFQVEYQLQDPPELTEADHQLSDLLREEINRIYRLDGGRELMELYQKEGLNVLTSTSKRIN